MEITELISRKLVNEEFNEFVDLCNKWNHVDSKEGKDDKIDINNEWKWDYNDFEKIALIC